MEIGCPGLRNRRGYTLHDCANLTPVLRWLIMECDIAVLVYLHLLAFEPICLKVDNSVNNIVFTMTGANMQKNEVEQLS